MSFSWPSGSHTWRGVSEYMSPAFLLWRSFKGVGSGATCKCSASAVWSSYCMRLLASSTWCRHASAICTMFPWSGTNRSSRSRVPASCPSKVIMVCGCWDPRPCVSMGPVAHAGCPKQPPRVDAASASSKACVLAAGKNSLSRGGSMPKTTSKKSVMRVQKSLACATGSLATALSMLSPLGMTGVSAPRLRR